MHPMHFALLGVDDVNFSLPDDKLFKWNGVRDVLVLVPINNGVCVEAPIYEVVNDPDGVLVTETP